MERTTTEKAMGSLGSLRSRWTNSVPLVKVITGRNSKDENILHMELCAVQQNHPTNSKGMKPNSLTTSQMPVRSNFMRQTKDFS